MSLLSLRNIEASYGVSQALFGVDLELAEGSVMALMGRNGMGKSTTVKVICRMLAARGEIRFDGRDISCLPSHRAPLVRQEIWDALSALKKSSGLTILIVDKSLKELRRICDHATVLERGKTAWSGPFADLTPQISERLTGV